MSDYEMPTLYEETHPVARKPHKCCECHREIPIGARYQHVKGMWDGDWRKFKTCEKCEDQREDLRDITADEIAPFEMLREWCLNSDMLFWADDVTTEQQGPL